MPRVGRVILPEVAVHVVQRGHDRGDCFFEEGDYRAYLDSLRWYAPRLGCELHAYCLMTNHVHLLLTPHEANSCGELMKHVAQRYSKRLNARWGRTGTAWEGRFYSALVTTERYALACYRYIELNPVRGSLVRNAADYRWSSHQANACAVQDDFLVPHPAYQALGRGAMERAGNYLAIFGVPLEQQVLQDIRKATRGGYAMGTPRKPRGRPSKMVTVTN